MAKTKIIESGKIDIEGLKKVGKGALIAGAGAILTALAEGIPGIDFGQYTGFAVAFSSILINLGRKYLLQYKKTE